MSERRGGSSGNGRVGAVVFDLFSTLTVPVDAAEFRSSRRAMARAVGVDPDAFAQGWSRSWRERYDGTYPTIHACVRRVCTAMGAPVDATAIARAAQIRIESERANAAAAGGRSRHTEPAACAGSPDGADQQLFAPRSRPSG